jgi:hypothetical protein
MLPFGVIQIEQYRALQQNAAELSFPATSLLTELSSERKFAIANRQRSGPLSLPDFAGSDCQNTSCPTQKNDAFLAKWAPTSNRQWPANRCYRKQTTKPRLTGTRTHIRPARRGGLSLNFTKIAQDFATLESQNAELSLRNPLWKTRRFLQTDRPLLPGSDQNVESDVTHRKQRTQKFLPGATTARTRSPNLTKIAQGSDELYN